MPSCSSRRERRPASKDSEGSRYPPGLVFQLRTIINSLIREAFIAEGAISQFVEGVRHLHDQDMREASMLRQSAKGAMIQVNIRGLITDSDDHQGFRRPSHSALPVLSLKSLQASRD